MSEQKDAPLETILGASDRQPLLLDIPTRAPERQPLPLDTPTRAPKCQPLLLDIPTRAPKCQPLPLENILGANGCHRPIKWFPTEANERQAHISENISGANERHRPLSNVRVGAYCIRPRCSQQGTIAPNRDPPPSDLSPAGSFEEAYAIRPYPTGGWDAVAREMVSDGSQWMAMARKKVSDGSESAFWAPIRFQFTSK